MIRTVTSRERGATLVEAALVLPVLVLLVFGLVEFGRAYNAQVTVTHAAREGVRVLALSNDPAAASDTAKAAATSLDPAQITVTNTPCDPGQPTELTVSYPFSYDIPFLGSHTITLNGKGVMRCSG